MLRLHPNPRPPRSILHGPHNRPAPRPDPHNLHGEHHAPRPPDAHTHRIPSRGLPDLRQVQRGGARVGMHPRARLLPAALGAIAREPPVGGPRARHNDLPLLPLLPLGC